MALDSACLTSILCSLSVPVRQAFSALIRSLIVTLNVKISELTAQLIIVDAAAAPLLVVKESLDAFKVQVIDQYLSLLPLSLFENSGCFDAIDLSNNLKKTVDDTAAEVDEILIDLARKLSFSHELTAMIADLQSQVTFWTDVLETLATCE